jgi:hypothetical protein
MSEADDFLKASLSSLWPNSIFSQKARWPNNIGTARPVLIWMDNNQKQLTVLLLPRNPETNHWTEVLGALFVLGAKNGIWPQIRTLATGRIALAAIPTKI